MFGFLLFKKKCGEKPFLNWNGFFIYLHQFVDVLLKCIWTAVRFRPSPQMGVMHELVRR